MGCLWLCICVSKVSEVVCVCVDVVAYKCSHAFVLAGGSVSVLLPAVAQYHLMKNSVSMGIRVYVCAKHTYVRYVE